MSPENLFLIKSIFLEIEDQSLSQVELGYLTRCIDRNTEVIENNNPVKTSPSY